MGKTIDGTDKKLIWVMTISKDFETVKFWDTRKH